MRSETDEDGRDCVENPKGTFTRRLTDPGGELLGSGVTGWVWLLKEDGTVLKRANAFDRDRNNQDLAWEAHVYRTIGRHHRLVNFLGHSERGLRLEHMPNGNLKDYLVKNPTVNLEQRYKWALHAAEGLELLHQHGIFHCDCKPSNYLVDDDLALRIIDFSDSKPMDTTRGSNENTRFYWPRHWREPPFPGSEAFALTCTIFQIMTGKAPFEEVPSDEVTRLYEQKQHPDLHDVPFTEFFEKGFAREFRSPSEILLWFRSKHLELS